MSDIDHDRGKAVITTTARGGESWVHRRKLIEWVKRYLPCEIISTAGEFGGVAIAYAMTGSFTAAALAATIGAFAGYYGMAYLTAVRWFHHSLSRGSRGRRLMTANLLALRSIAVEFGLGEAIDSLLVRPATYYAIPQLLGGNVVLGWVIAKVISDLAFYGCAVFSYERFSAVVAAGPDRGVDASGRGGTALD